MDTALVVITLLSIGLTGALLVYAARLQREQREREEARVYALAGEIRGEWESRGRDGDGPLTMWREDWDSSLATGRENGDSPLPTLFAGDDAEAAGSRRFVVPLVGAVIVSSVLGGIYLVSARPATATAVPAAPASVNLELVELHHARAAQALTVTGVVRNPRGAKPQEGVTAVVFVFDKAGAFVTSGRAPIDYQKLEAGDESPFTVTVPNAHAVARYKVSFRTGRDVLPHVDRRVDPGASPKGSRAQGPKGSRVGAEG